MAEQATLARPYARAAFEAALARGEDALPQFSQELALIAECVRFPEIRAELNSPVRMASEKAKLINELLPEELSGSGRNFVAVLAEHGRLLLTPEIQKQFEQQRAAYERVLNVDITSAQPLSDPEQEQLRERLSRRFERRVELHVDTDASLIGGVIIRAGDTVIDGSVRGRLGRLAARLGVTNQRAGSAPAA